MYVKSFKLYIREICFVARWAGEHPKIGESLAATITLYDSTMLYSFLQVYIWSYNYNRLWLTSHLS